ncbi:MAG: DNA-directed RNA polymerase subunit omega [Ignavibacteriaceae bacterium]|nr:DNA-directed RNA polymerase subunit omega [Ignavibacteriaceae bacterium]HRI47979.1 DNA-directed RNA polymerase subunit omega [Ignavibacteriaceae bacterium]
MGIQPIDLRAIDNCAANVYEAIVACGKKARQLNEEQRLEYNSMLTTVPSSNSDDDSEDFDNPAQLKLSLDFEKRDKPHHQAVKILLQNKLEYSYKSKH